jgi:hypothetical protein
MSTRTGFRTPRTPTEFIEAAGSMTPLAQGRVQAPGAPEPRPAYQPGPASAPAPSHALPEPNARVKRQVNFDLPEPDHRRLSEMVESMTGRMSIRKFIVMAVQEKMDRLDHERGQGR